MSKNKQKTVSVPMDETEKELIELKKKIQELEMENAFLRKLDTIVQERIERENSR